MESFGDKIGSLENNNSITGVILQFFRRLLLFYEASAIELPLPVRRFPIFTCLCQVKPMEKPVDRTKQAIPAGAACRSYPIQLASIGYTSEHEHWALMIASMAVQWRWGCARARVPECVCQACPKPSVWQMEGISLHPQHWQAAGRQAGSMSPIDMQQRVQGLHATPHNTPPPENSHKPRHTEHATCLNSPQLFPSSQPSTPRPP